MKKITLILATIGRVVEVDEFIQSLLFQDNLCSELELIVVDQNKDGRLDAVVNKHKSKVNIIHIKSDLIGLSKNRNIGLKFATGDIVGFPDDDCTYYKTTLASVEREFLNLRVDAVIGRIYDKQRNVNIIKKWPKIEMRINRFNYYNFTSSITLFQRSNNCGFDDEFGVGAEYGSNEDVDLVYRLLNKKCTIIYTPEVEVWHPDQELKSIPLEKVIMYGVGFGAFVRKNMSISNGGLFVAALSYHLLKMIFAIIILDAESVKARWFCVKSRIAGFIKYKTK